MALNALSLRPAQRLSGRLDYRSLQIFRRPFWSANSTVPFPVVESCPAPTCACAPTPEGLDIDHKLTLFNTKPPHNRHLVVCTGRSNWASRIEDDEVSPNLAKSLKGLLGPKGRYYNPELNLLITNSSFQNQARSSTATSAYLFPDFKYFQSLELGEESEFVESVLQPDSGSNTLINRGVDIKTISVLICGHGGRDQRCGVYGPLLEHEFRRVMSNAGMNVAKAMENSTPTWMRHSGKLDVRIGLVSHIGGHKWAGNVIIYNPRERFAENGDLSPLAGCGIWYGRVEPKHVEGIVQETVLGGKVIKELYRGTTGP